MKKWKLIDWSITITIASTLLYIVFRNLGRELGSFAFLWAPISLALIIIKRPKTFYGDPIRVLLVYGVIMVLLLQYTLWKNMDDWNKMHILFEFYYLIVFMAILLYYLRRGELRKLAKLSKFSFIVILLSLLTTNIALVFDPNIVRQSAATDDFTLSQSEIYKITGAMSYSYIQAMICLIPILVYHIKKKRELIFKPKFLVLTLLLIYITLLRAQVFANILIATLIIILSFMASSNPRFSFFMIIIIGIILIAIPNTLYSNIFYSLSTKFSPDSEMSHKLSDFAEFIVNPEFEAKTETGGRAARYPLLFDALLAQPFFGNASINSNVDISGGAHLYWANRLALWGIPGFVFFIFVLRRIYLAISSLFDPTFRLYYSLSVAALVLIGLTKAIGGREPWLMLMIVIPGLYYLPLLSTNLKKIASKMESSKN